MDKMCILKVFWTNVVVFLLGLLNGCEGLGYSYYYTYYYYYYSYYKYSTSSGGLVAGIVVGCVVGIAVAAVVIALCIKQHCKTTRVRGHVIRPSVQTISTAVTSVTYNPGYTSTYQGPPSYHSTAPPSYQPTAPTSYQPTATTLYQPTTPQYPPPPPYPGSNELYTDQPGSIQTSHVTHRTGLPGYHQ